MENLPLLELFTQLREAGFPLGIDDYQAVLEALQAGFGIGDRATLARLCRTLWVKSEEELRLFDYHFERSIIPQTKSLTPPASSLNLIPVAEQSPSDDTLIKTLSLRKIFATLGVYALSVGVLVLPYAFFARLGRTNHYPIFTSQAVEEVVHGRLYEYKIKAEDIDAKDTLTIEAWIEINREKYQITEQGISADEPGQKPLSHPNSLRFKDHGDGTATLFGTFEQVEKTEEPSGSKARYQIELQVKDQQGGSDLQAFNIRETDELSSGKPFPVLWLLLMYAGLYAGLPVTLYLIYRRSQTSASQSPSEPPSEPPTSTDTTSSSKGFTETVDEVQVTSPASQLSQKLPTISRRSFRQTTEYFPLTRRQMKQSWRFLRRMVRTGTATELDMRATLDKIGRQGVLVEPVLVPRQVNQSKLLLLIDQDGSMVPFHGFSERLAETAVRGGRLEDTNVYYFHNCPIDYLYGDRYCYQTESIEIDEVLKTVQSSYTGVLVFSDAGAARGTFNAERLELTTAFLATLKRRIRYLAWLNPVPSSRWLGTTASEIAQVVPMFELNRRGLDNAISVLRGRFR